MKHFCKIRFAILLILTVLISGCAKTTPTENIIGQHVQLVDEALSDPTLSNEAKSALKTCRAGLLSAQETHQAEISKCDAEKSKLKTERNGLFLAVLLLVGFMIYKPVRKFLHL